MSGPLGLIEAWLKGNIDAAPILTWEHFEAHEGSMYHIDGYDPTLPDDGVLSYGIRTGPTTPHVTFAGACGGNGVGYLFEAPTFTASGTVFTPLNMRRDSPKVPGLRVYEYPTVSVSGTYLHGQFIPGGTFGLAGAQGANRVEWILQPNSWYMAFIQNVSGGAQPFGFTMEFYEHTIKLADDPNYA